MSRRRLFRTTGGLVASVLAVGTLAGGLAHAATTTITGYATSADGTKIGYSLYIPDAASPVPVVFNTHGWGGSRLAVTDSRSVLLLSNGYAVMTWDARGFGTSGGEANTDSQEFEVRDTQALIDLVADPSVTTAIQLDGPGNPRMGMAGGSYAGGIQLETAAADNRVDAIVPEIAWNDLPQALKPGGVIKLGWDLLLYGAGAAAAASGGLTKDGTAKETGVYAPQIHQSLIEGLALNDWTTATYNWFDARSPKYYINGATLADGTVLPGINAPTLIIQGTSDTLFTLNQGIANYKAITARGVPSKMLFFCGGHTITPLGTSCTVGTNQAVRDAAMIGWLNRYVKGDLTVDTGAAIDYQLQDGTFRSIAALPGTVDVPGTQTRVTHYGAPTTGQGTAGTVGGCAPKVGTSNSDTAKYAVACPVARGDWIALGTQTGPPLPTCGAPPKPSCEPTFAPFPAGTQVLGSVKLALRVTGTSPETYLFFKLVDYDKVAAVATVVDDQVTAQKVSWPNLNIAQAVNVTMAGVAWIIKPGHVLYLETTPSSNDHASSRFPGSVTAFVNASVPVIAP